MCPRWMEWSGRERLDRMEVKKRAYPVVTLGSAALQGRIAVESGDSAPIAGCSGPVPMVWAPRAARGALMRAVHRRRAKPVEDRALGWVHQ